MRWDLFAILMLLPWAATFGGSVLAARMQSGGPKRQGAMLGFAAGIMIAASIWSLILPAFDNAGKTPAGAAVVSLGFLLGCLGMLLLDKLVPHQHMDEASPEGRPSHMSRPKLLVLAVALHNIPEGMALGVVIAAAMGDAGMSWTAAPCRTSPRGWPSSSPCGRVVPPRGTACGGASGPVWPNPPPPSSAF